MVLVVSLLVMIAALVATQALRQRGRTRTLVGDRDRARRESQVGGTVAAAEHGQLHARWPQS